MALMPKEVGVSLIVWANGSVAGSSPGHFTGRLRRAIVAIMGRACKSLTQGELTRIDEYSAGYRSIQVYD